MTIEITMERSETTAQDCWNVEALYSSFADWEKDLTEWGGKETLPRWPELFCYKENLKNSPKELRACLERYFEISRHLSKLYTYAHLRHDENVKGEKAKNAYIRISSVLHDFQAEISWIEPTILTLPPEYFKAGELRDFSIYLEKIIRLKPHTLPAPMEELLAVTGKALETAHRTFSAFNNADLKFPKIADEKGQLQELTHGSYLVYLRGQDRTLRENAFKTMHQSFLKFENTLCELINGEVQVHLAQMRARGFSSCLEAALFPHQIDTSVYRSLIEAVRSRLSSLHNYLALRKQILGLDELHVYDLHVPLVSDVDFSTEFKEAEDLIIASVAPLGSLYQSDLEKGLKVDRWVDRYENVAKRSGAYSSGCYDSMPYILMNYHRTFNDMMTLAHEAGHSMHSLMSNRHQPYHYAQYPIFVAEVASTFNENFLLRHLTCQTSDKAQRCYLINQEIEGLRNTLFRQTMFAEFELTLHEWAEQGVPLTPALLKETYRKLNHDYFGEEVILDDEIEGEWARIPHFYYNFYVYQYATGISAAYALAKLVVEEGLPAQERYLKFLSSGSSQYPIDLLAEAGVDMREKKPVEMAIDHFDTLVQELKKLLL
ncbi:MAG: oligoendopeptidase F [Chlamydiota bacterium]